MLLPFFFVVFCQHGHFWAPPRSFEARPVGEQVDQNLGQTTVDLLQVGDFKTLKVEDNFFQWYIETM